MGKTVKSRKSAAVQGTNDSSSVSKSSMVYKGYFEDDFITYFVKKKVNGNPLIRSPLINRGYYIRNYVLNKIICDFQRHFNLLNVPTQLISIGSGFDTTFFRLKKQKLLLPGSFYVEVDFPELQRRKLTLIKCTEELRPLIGESTDLKVDSDAKNVLLWNGPCYKMIGCDLTETSKLSDLLINAGVNFDTPTLVLSEVVLTYLDVGEASKFIAWTSQKFRNSAFVTYEQIYPYDEFGEFMCEHFKKLGSPLKSVFSFHTAESQVERYIKQGWQVCSASTMIDFYLRLLPEVEAHRLETLEMFDEYEEWILKCIHYFVLIATQGTCFPLSETIWKELSIFGKSGACDGFESKLLESSNLSSISHHSELGSEAFSKKICISNESATEMESENLLVDVELEELKCSRFGHSSCILDFKGRKHLFVIGGFGDANAEELSCSKSSGASKEVVAHQDPTKINLNPEVDSKVIHCRMKRASIFYLGFPRKNEPRQSSLLASFSSPLFERMHSSCTLLEDGRIFVFGGRKSPESPCSSVLLLTLDKETQQSLERISVSELNGCKHLTFKNFDLNVDVELSKKSQDPDASSSGPTARWRHSATALRVASNGGLPESNELIIIHGGQTTGCRALDDTWCLDTSTWAWKALPTSINAPGFIHSHSSDWWRKGCALVVSGGMDSRGMLKNSIHIFELVSNQWKVLELSGHLEKRFSHTSHVHGDQLILVGGVGTRHPSPGISVVDLITGTTQNFHVSRISKEIRPSCYQFHKHTSHLLKKDTDTSETECPEVFVLGGGGNYFSFGTKIRTGGLNFKLKL